MGQIILASASPRRKELLEQIGLEFEICPAKGEEVISKSAPEEVVMELSEQKATEVAAMVKTYESGHGELMTPQDILVIGADTVVACDDTILGKPKDEADVFVESPAIVAPSTPVSASGVIMNICATFCSKVMPAAICIA